MKDEEENKIPSEGLLLFVMIGMMLGGTILINFIIWLFIGDFKT
tara:strand:- start:1371 stop:1502 length:132 start_codon:yes stop_codon:yes gene_type:complete